MEYDPFAKVFTGTIQAYSFIHSIYLPRKISFIEIPLEDSYAKSILTNRRRTHNSNKSEIEIYLSKSSKYQINRFRIKNLKSMEWYGMSTGEKSTAPPLIAVIYCGLWRGKQ